MATDRVCDCEPTVWEDGSVTHEDDCLLYPWCPHEVGPNVCLLPCGCPCEGCQSLDRAFEKYGLEKKK